MIGNRKVEQCSRKRGSEGEEMKKGVGTEASELIVLNEPIKLLFGLK
jgi:hypothetical protein